MRLRMGERLSYELDLPHELRQTAVPAMLLQPLVENAIRHGLEPQVGAGRLVVRARRVGAGVEIAVSDTGLGLDATAEPERGYGLQHVGERLARAYGPRGSVTLSAEPAGGARAVVCIPA
jgi:LytS/YehU family sensor histidine kinase